ncbi:hypothetical protein TeGR_g5443 [Tetraparma gracilis]|uniref:26S proteasome non-ATPase regulatory subunit 5 n=1 Tax=Tetraparma gracilis TaxID=2962635 RepID=A0ABQ6MXP1_9STRA|nr:hypothetical protein TeGR_g5443 [Tetraparma gracilis]
MAYAAVSFLRQLLTQHPTSGDEFYRKLDANLGRLAAQIKAATPDVVLGMMQGLLPLLLVVGDVIHGDDFTDREDNDQDCLERVLLALNDTSKEVADRLYASLRQGVVARRLGAIECLSQFMTNEDDVRKVLGDDTLLQALAGNFMVSRRHLADASFIFASLDIAGVFHYLDVYADAVRTWPDDGACAFFVALSEHEPVTVWQQPQFIDAIIGVLSSEQYRHGYFYAMQTLTNLGAVPEIAEAMRATPRLITAMCLPKVAEYDFYRCLLSVPCRNHVSIVTELLRSDPSRVLEENREGWEWEQPPPGLPDGWDAYPLTPLQVAQMSGCDDIVPIVASVVREVESGALDKGWSLQHVLGYSEAEKVAARRCRVTTILCLRSRGWPRTWGEGESASAWAWRTGVQRNYGDCEDVWSLILKYAF